jgi:hypothetical protein
LVAAAWIALVWGGAHPAEAGPSALKVTFDGAATFTEWPPAAARNSDGRGRVRIVGDAPPRAVFLGRNFQEARDLGPVPLVGCGEKNCVQSAPIPFVIDAADAAAVAALDGAGAPHRARLATVGDAFYLYEAESPAPLGGPITIAALDGGTTVLPRKLAVFRLDAPRGTPEVALDSKKRDALIDGAVAGAITLWKPCGIAIVPLPVHRLPPPPPHLLSFGDELGLPAGTTPIHLRFAIKTSPKETTFDLLLPPGTEPAEAAERTAEAIEAKGFSVRVRRQPPVASGAHATVDLAVRDSRSNELLPLEATGSVSSDPHLAVHIGRVDLDDALTHFDDGNAYAGTLEERTLLSALSHEGERAGIHADYTVLVIPSLGGDGRVGEAFLRSDGGAVHDTVLIDRGGLRAGMPGNTLAHELGHAMLDFPGHSDAYGHDTPMRLMDSDASAVGAYGPRRLTAEECRRARSNGASPSSTAR